MQTGGLTRGSGVEHLWEEVSNLRQRRKGYDRRDHRAQGRRRLLMFRRNHAERCLHLHRCAALRSAACLTARLVVMHAGAAGHLRTRRRSEALGDRRARERQRQDYRQHLHDGTGEESHCVDCVTCHGRCQSGALAA